MPAIGVSESCDRASHSRVIVAKLDSIVSVVKTNLRAHGVASSTVIAFGVIFEAEVICDIFAAPPAGRRVDRAKPNSLLSVRSIGIVVEAGIFGIAGIVSGLVESAAQVSRI